MIPRRSQLHVWNPRDLTLAGEEIGRTAEDTRTRADDVQRAVSDLGRHDDWRGPAQAAAEQRANSERTEIRRLADDLEDLSNALVGGADRLGHARDYVATVIDKAATDGFTVSDDWQIVSPPKTMSEAEAAEHADLMEYWRSQLGGALTELDTADRDMATAIRDALGAVAATAPASAGLSGHEGTALGEQVARGGSDIPQDVRDRVAREIAAAGLTPEQVKTLADGGKVTDLPQGTIDFLQQFYTAAGKDGFLALSEQYSENGRTHAAGALSNGLAVMSNYNVSSASGDVGGQSHIPESLRGLFEGPVTSTGNLTKGAHDAPQPSLIVNNGDDLARFTKAFGLADPGVQQGSELSESLLSRAGEIASATNDKSLLIGDSFDHNALGRDSVDTLLQDMVGVGGRDHVAVHSILSGEGMPADYNRDDVIMPLLQRDWADGGEQKVAGMFDWIADDARPSDPSDPGEMFRSTQAGESAFGLAQILAAKDAELLDIPGMKGQAIGEVNPEITQALGTTLAPYIGNMVGVPGDFAGTSGFASPTGGEFGLENAPRLFSVIDSNADAASYFNAQAFGMSAQLEQAWALEGLTPQVPHYEYGSWAGSIQGVVDKGLDLEFADRVGDESSNNSASFESKGVAYDTIRTVVSKGAEFIPGAGPIISSGIDLADSAFKSAVIGVVPDSTVQPNTQFAEDSLLAKQYYQIALGLQAANGGSLDPYVGLEDFREGVNGPLLPYDEIVSDRPSFTTPLLSSSLAGYITEAGFTGVGEFVDAMNAGREQVQNMEFGR
ncbi:WXG100 family type VII secretion target [Rhodococcus sp. NPDC127530]|uniref:WXG100 family type VII secretion target n=1 Tax=unclassified Rhodococcus (in: high G+C Gram-positive bacteria) TaxID=192944 RepID=UPI00363D0C13